MSGDIGQAMEFIMFVLSFSLISSSNLALLHSPVCMEDLAVTLELFDIQIKLDQIRWLVSVFVTVGFSEKRWIAEYLFLAVWYPPRLSDDCRMRIT